jgi:GT2 family glycosyltransferase
MSLTIVPSSCERGPRLSIVIVNWNSSVFLRECLRSLEADSIFEWAEVIVIDNRSEDDSADMVRQHFPMVRLHVSNENLGYGRGNNYGLQLATGRYILFLNPDTVVYPGTIRKMVHYAASHPHVGALSPKLYGSDGKIQYEAAVNLPTIWNVFCDFLFLSKLFPRSRLFASRKLGHWDHEQPREVPAVCGAAMLVRRTALSRCGAFDPCMFYVEDMDLCLRLRNEGYSVFYLGSVGMTHYGGGSSPKSPASYARQRQIGFQSFWIYRRKHFGSFSAARLSVAIFVWSVLSLAALYLLRIISMRKLSLIHQIELAKSLFRWSLADKMTFTHHLAEPLKARLLNGKAA